MGIHRPTMCELVLEKEPTKANRLRFESFPVETGIPEQYQSNWKPAVEGGAPEPLFWTWGGGGWANWTLSLKFQAGTELSAPQEGAEERILADMERKVRWLLALGAPKGKKRPPSELRTNARPGDPPVVLVVFGSFMTLRCLCLGTSVVWGPDGGPWDPVTCKPHGAKVDVALQRVSGFYPDWYTIAEGQTTLSGASGGTVTSPPPTSPPVVQGTVPAG